MKKLMTGLGIAAIAALALSAFVAPTSAFAVSALCSNSGTGAQCAGGGAGDNELVAGDKIIAKAAETIRLTSGFVNVTCSESEVELSLESNTPPHGKITKLTFGGDCHSNLNTTKNSCSATTSASATNGWTTDATTTTAPNGKMVVEGVEGDFTCNILGANTTCIYKATKAGDGHSTGEEIAIIGGAPASVEAKHVELSKATGSASSCSATAIWEGKYTVTSPTSLYMT